MVIVWPAEGNQTIAVARRKKRLSPTHEFRAVARSRDEFACVSRLKLGSVLNKAAGISIGETFMGWGVISAAAALKLAFVTKLSRKT